MSKNTILFGLLIAGGLLGYFVCKKKSADSVKNSKKTSDSASGTFVDDVPVPQEVANELLQGAGGVKTPVKSLKNTISDVLEPLFGTNQEVELSGKGQFIES